MEFFLYFCKLYSSKEYSHFNLSIQLFTNKRFKYGWLNDFQRNF